MKWLCDYIKMQATKEQLHHSKDLHTMIVAAFNTILIWVKEKPSLLASKVWIERIKVVIHSTYCTIYDYLFLNFSVILAMVLVFSETRAFT